MRNIGDLLAILESKYSNPVSLVRILEKRYSLEIKEGEEIQEKKELPKEAHVTEVVLTNDTEKNKQFIMQLMSGVDDFMKQVDISKEDEIRIKLITEYKKQLGKIADRKLASGDKLADSICKCIRKTIFKLIDIEKFANVIKKYLQTNGLVLNSFEEGHQLSDDDLCYLDENLLQAYKVKTENPKDNYRVIEMVQPIVKIRYIDEDDNEIYSHFIPGICKYFVREVGR